MARFVAVKCAATTAVATEMLAKPANRRSDDHLTSGSILMQPITTDCAPPPPNPKPARWSRLFPNYTRNQLQYMNYFR
jgi:hypothetical protein